MHVLTIKMLLSMIAGFAMFMNLTASPQAAQQPANEPELHCVKTLDAYTKPSERIDYKGIRYGTCCEGCAAAFISEPEVWIKKAVAAKSLIGYSLFDVVSGARVIPLPKSPYTDYKAVRYYFKTDEDKSAFDADPAHYSEAPEKELMHCVIYDQPIKKETDSAGYVEVDGVRYYVCCGSCFSSITQNTAEKVAKFASRAVIAKPHLLPNDQ